MRDGLQAYTQLQQCQSTVPLVEHESARVNEVLARLKAWLRYFGEDV